MVEIVSYKQEYASYFKQFNMDWLNEFFTPETYDIEVLSHPDRYILQKKGDIFFLLKNQQPKGTIALMYNENGELELTKMGIDKSAQGKGYGNLLLAHSIEQAKEKGKTELILYSNTKLEPAIYLYKKYGFVEVPLEQSEYKRCNIKMKKIL